MLDPDDEQVIQDCNEGGGTLVTWDRVVRVAAGGLTPYEVMDKAVQECHVDGEEGEKALAEVGRLRKLSPAQLTVMADEADKTWHLFDDNIHLTREAAMLIRRLRVKHDYSWRAIARVCSREWHAPWGGNQIAGMVICEKAAKLLGEDFLEQPWD